jgi:DNA-binding transcriptional MerR regulator
VSASTSHDSSHLSIGEVLNILREEFPDITISKIRFLESQGLIDPERTPSGYRKFYTADVSRLRWILHQQKENFLPLKVIKERLELLGDSAQPAPVSAIAPGSTAAPVQRRRSRRSAHPDPDVAPPLPFDEPTPVPHGELTSTTQTAGTVETASTPQTARTAQTASTAETASALPEKRGLTRDELARSIGLEDWQLEELESFGFVTPNVDVNDAEYFDDEGQVIAKAAAGFYAHGIGARHLRMYKHFAEREAALFGQVSMQYLRQRNPDARVRAQEELATLSRLGRALRAALLVQAIRDSFAE